MYAIKVTALPSVERFTDISDLELKLVVAKFGGIGSVLTSVPDVVSWSRKMGDVIPKLPSTLLLFQTLLLYAIEGYKPLSVAFPLPQEAVKGHTGGNGWPSVTVVKSPV
jgi:hypothetical protein